MRISITGKQGEGKTTVLHFIQRALEQCGIVTQQIKYDNGGDSIALVVPANKMESLVYAHQGEPDDPSIEGEELAFWETVFVAAINSGQTSNTGNAALMADSALAERRRRESGK